MCQVVEFAVPANQKKPTTHRTQQSLNNDMKAFARSTRTENEKLFVPILLN